MATQRKAHARWEGNLTDGSGTVKAGSNALPEFPVNWKARTQGSESVTSPEELLAAAEAACFSMALSGDLVKAGYEPKSVESTATAVFEQVDGKWTVSTMNLEVAARVPDLDEAEFQKIANGTKSGCPISRAIANNVNIHLSARLEK